MVKYHPDARFLTDYTAGSLPESQALCVATHLHYCQACKLKVRELTELGSLLFMQLQPATVPSSDFERLMHRVENLLAGSLPLQARAVASDVPTPFSQGLSALQASTALLPRPLHKLTRGNLDSLKWRRFFSHFRYSRIRVGDHSHETSFVHILPGGNVPHHTHSGDEITVVIQGSFSDQDGHYSVGDFLHRTCGEAHQPIASREEECFCLSTFDAPIVMTNPFYRLLTPLM